ncbi:hypothetical protein [Nocardia mexicana]|uniref:DUF397 domain-containing protein n=1 Tax=Nocardia mexicana TaxID=279262 RepID=A0A370GNH4_9NOCA|nr:hypothetical protein [Nocardia mexicana]RDI45278.1 hypothetical protein DFR68_11347 [Nocardia mexicana]
MSVAAEAGGEDEVAAFRAEVDAQLFEPHRLPVPGAVPQVRGPVAALTFDPRVDRRHAPSVVVNDPSRQPIIAVTAAAWPSFLQLATGRLADITPGLPVIEHDRDGGVTLRTQDGISLSYTRAEWDAYLSGIRAGEFAAA